MSTIKKLEFYFVWIFDLENFQTFLCAFGCNESRFFCQTSFHLYYSKWCGKRMSFKVYSHIKVICLYGKHGMYRFLWWKIVLFSYCVERHFIESHLKIPLVQSEEFLHHLIRQFISSHLTNFHLKWWLENWWYWCGIFFRFIEQL